MDEKKCKLLKKELSEQSEPQFVPINQFFDGNDDPGSIGCNLIEHPGIALFRNTLASLSQRPDVEAVYAQITEVDPGEDSWPFSDTVFVVGDIPEESLKDALRPLDPDEIWVGDESQIPLGIRLEHKAPTLVAWWD